MILYVKSNDLKTRNILLTLESQDFCVFTNTYFVSMISNLLIN